MYLQMHVDLVLVNGHVKDPKKQGKTPSYIPLTGTSPNEQMGTQIPMLLWLHLKLLQQSL